MSSTWEKRDRWEMGTAPASEAHRLQLALNTPPGGLVWRKGLGRRGSPELDHALPSALQWTPPHPRNEVPLHPEGGERGQWPALGCGEGSRVVGLRIG